MSVVKMRRIVIVCVGNENRFVLVQNPSARSQNWQFAGGLLREDENPETGAIRKCTEEIGITVRPESLHLLKMLIQDGTDDIRRFFYSYSVRVTDELLRTLNVRGPKSHRLKLVECKELRNYIIKKQRALVVP